VSFGSRIVALICPGGRFLHGCRGFDEAFALGTFIPVDIMWHTTQTAGGDDLVPIYRWMPYKAFF
jgi:hypothetical protein